MLLCIKERLCMIHTCVIEIIDGQISNVESHLFRKVYGRYVDWVLIFGNTMSQFVFLWRRPLPRYIVYSQLPLHRAGVFATGVTRDTYAFGHLLPTH